VGNQSCRRGHVSPRDFYAYHLHSREDERDTLLRGRRVYQEYLCMAMAKVLSAEPEFLHILLYMSMDCCALFC
jgi:hypothetical protein